MGVKWEVKRYAQDECEAHGFPYSLSAAHFNFLFHFHLNFIFNFRKIKLLMIIWISVAKIGQFKHKTKEK